MAKLQLETIQPSDQPLFAKWWRSPELQRFTSGSRARLTDGEIERHFETMQKNRKDSHYLIRLGAIPIGHIALAKRRGGWYETQIIIGDRRFRNRGFGHVVIRTLLSRAKREGITRIYLEVRPDNIRAIKTYKKAGFIPRRIIRHKSRLLPRTLRMEYARK